MTAPGATTDRALATHLDDVAPVSLEELGARAERLTRVDRKYLVPAADLPALLAQLPARTRVLGIDGQRRFRYDTVYFDTPQLRSYRDAARGRPLRWKVRARSYLDSGAEWIEVKLRDRRGLTAKHRQARPPGIGRRLDGADRAFARQFADGRALHESCIGSLIPTLRTAYERITLLEPATDSRVTIDLDLRCAHPSGDAVALDGIAVVETKTDGRPSPVDRALWALGHRPHPMSKYGTGMAAIRSDLPANRWHRTLAIAPFRPDRTL